MSEKILVDKGLFDALCESVDVLLQQSETQPEIPDEKIQAMIDRINDAAGVEEEESEESEGVTINRTDLQ
jgi:hypothetical protein